MNNTSGSKVTLDNSDVSAARAWRPVRRPSSRSASATTRPAPNPRKASGAAAPRAEATARVIPLTRSKLCIPCSVTQTPRRPWLGGLALSKATLESVICNEGLCTPGKETYAVASKASSAFIFSRTAL